MNDKRKLLVSESICGGGCAESPPASFVREGYAMLAAVLDDFSRLDHVETWTTWDRRMERRPLAATHVIDVTGPDDERRVWNDLVGDITDVLIIAPETEGVLADRVEFFEGRSINVLGPSSEAIRLCGDKWETYLFFRSRLIPTIETELIFAGRPVPRLGGQRGPFVVKPRDGAGSHGMRLVNDITDVVAETDAGCVLQPYIAGTALSCSAIVARSGRVDVFPVGRQAIDDANGFAYDGGEIPAQPPLAEAIEEHIRKMIRVVCEKIPGLNGYVGFDFILPDESPTLPLVVEINPRLTTSYLGYRQLTDDNLAGRMWDLKLAASKIRWNRAEPVTFSPNWTTDAASA